MDNELSFINLFWQASLLVKLVISLLLCTSIISWGLILQRGALYRKLRKELKHFNATLRKSKSLHTLYCILNERERLNQIEQSFLQGYQEYVLAQKANLLNESEIFERVFRAMQVRKNNLIQRLNDNLSWLATIGSVSPYVGLFGTVWGIMHSFLGLTHIQQNNLAAIAPGIAEALIATAVGLFVAIPAVIAYNRYANLLNQFDNSFDSLRDKLCWMMVHKDKAVGVI